METDLDTAFVQGMVISTGTARMLVESACSFEGFRMLDR
jgi:hypothetical protein